MRPWIGITQRLRDGDAAPDGARLQLDPAYAEAVAEAGAVPVHLPIQEDVAHALARLDALVIPGGPDFPPDPPCPDLADVAFDPVAERQLAFDRAVLRAAADRELPVLGICYGMQLQALEAGGALDHHLPRDRPEAGEHRLPRESPGHPIAVEPGSRLAAALGPGAHAVNSRHHQAVRDAGGWRVVARSDDGVVEAIEAPGPTWRLGVQWHPESMERAHRLAIFGALVAAAGAR